MHATLHPLHLACTSRHKMLLPLLIFLLLTVCALQGMGVVEKNGPGASKFKEGEWTARLF